MNHPLLPKIFDLLIDMVCVVDEQGRYVFVSAACERLLGYTPEELIGRNMIDLVHPDDRERTIEAAANVMRGRSHLHFENRYVRKDGRTVHLMWSATWSPSDHVRMAVARDVTDLKHAEHVQRALYRISEAAHAAEGLSELYHRIHQVIADLLPAENFAVVHYDQTANMLSFPYFVDEREPRPQPRILDAGDLISTVIRSGQPLLTYSGPIPDAWLGVPLISQDDVIGAIVVRTYSAGAAYTSGNKDLLRFVSTQIAAVIERKRTQIRMYHLARHDALTELPNRVLFRDRLETALKRARRDGEHLALLYVDLDDFKKTNDTFGHEIGDLLLCEVARRMAQCVRASDTVARMGGDEFTVLLINIRENSVACAIAEKIRAAVEAPCELNGKMLDVSASIGVAVCPEDGRDAEQLLRHADTAMYAGKRGRG